MQPEFSRNGGPAPGRRARGSALGLTIARRQGDASPHKWGGGRDMGSRRLQKARKRRRLALKSRRSGWAGAYPMARRRRSRWELLQAATPRLGLEFNRVHAARVGGHRLSVDTWHAVIARIDAIRAGWAIIALNNHDVRANTGGAHHHEGQQRHAGHQRPPQNGTMNGVHSRASPRSELVQRAPSDRS